MTDAGSAPRLNVAVLLDNFVQPAWVERVITDVRNSPVAELVLVIRTADADRRPRRWRRLIERPDRVLYELYTALDDFLFRPVRGRPFISAVQETAGPDPFTAKEVGPLLASVPTVTIDPGIGSSPGLAGPDLERLADHALDVILLLSSEHLAGTLGSAARFGAWSYLHGDDRRYRGGPPGFWEVFERAPVTGSLLQAHMGADGRREVLCRSFATTDKFSVARNKANYYWTASAFVGRMLREVHRFGCPPTGCGGNRPPFEPYPYRAYGPPQNGEMTALLAKHGVRVLRDRLRHRSSPTHWALAFQSETLALSLPAFRDLLPPPGREWADPFPLAAHGRHFVFFEERLLNQEHGHISVIEMDEKGRWSEPRAVVEAPHHLSFPFIFEWQGTYYMVPESVAVRRVEAYRCVTFPDEWEREAVLLDGVRAVDTTVALVGDRWWLFTNIAEEGARDFDELHVFHADEPLGPWSPHARNPVRSDARGTRSAGRMIDWHGALLRPVQDSGGRYGRAVRFHEIVRLDEEVFEEREVAHIEPKWDKRIEATHTYNSVPGLTVIDGLMRRGRQVNR